MSEKVEEFEIDPKFLPSHSLKIGLFAGFLVGLCVALIVGGIGTIVIKNMSVRLEACEARVAVESEKTEP